MLTYAAMALLCFGVSVLGTVAGFGGGIIVIPMLTVLFDVPIHLAIGSTMLALVPGAGAAAYGYLRRRLIDFPLGLWTLITTLGLTYVGAAISASLSAEWLEPLYTVLLLLLARKMWFNATGVARPPGALSRALMHLNQVGPIFRRDRVDALGVHHRYAASFLLVLVLGAAAGTVAGLFGVGGGIFTTPVMVLAFKVPVRVAVATSLMMTTVVAAVGSASHYAHGHVDLELAGVLAAGMTLGGLLGPRLGGKLSEKKLKYAVAGMLGGVGLITGLSAVVHRFS